MYLNIIKPMSKVNSNSSTTSSKNYYKQDLDSSIDKIFMLNNSKEYKNKITNHLNNDFKLNKYDIEFSSEVNISLTISYTLSVMIFIIGIYYYFQEEDIYYYKASLFLSFNYILIFIFIKLYVNNTFKLKLANNYMSIIVNLVCFMFVVFKTIPETKGIDINTIRIFYIITIFTNLYYFLLNLSIISLILFNIFLKVSFYLYYIKLKEINVNCHLLPDYIFCMILSICSYFGNYVYIKNKNKLILERCINYNISNMVDYYTKIINRAQNFYFISLKNKSNIYFTNDSFYRFISKDASNNNNININSNTCHYNSNKLNKTEYKNYNFFFDNLINLEKSNIRFSSILEHVIDKYNLNNNKSNKDYVDNSCNNNVNENNEIDYLIFSSNNINKSNNDNNAYNELVHSSEYQFKNMYFEINLYLSYITDSKIIEIEIYNISKPKSAEILIQNKAKEKQNFLMKVAHEFKTPLYSIITLIRELSEKNRNLNKSNIILANNEVLNKKCDYLEEFVQIENLSNYILILISDFIQSSKESELHIDKQPFKLKDTLEFCFSVLNTLLSIKNKDKFVKTVINYNDTFSSTKFDQIEDIIAMSDEVRIKQVLLNVLSNSVKFTKYGYINITCYLISEVTNLEATLLNNNYLRYCIKIEIEDTGYGINNNTINYINKRDYDKIEINTLGNSIGSGIGISVCHNISDKLDLNYKIISELNKGTKVVFDINNVKVYLKNNESSVLNKNKAVNNYNKNNNNLPFKNIINDMSFEDNLFVNSPSCSKYPFLRNNKITKTCINNKKNNSYNNKYLKNHHNLYPYIKSHKLINNCNAYSMLNNNNKIMNKQITYLDTSEISKLKSTKFNFNNKNSNLLTEFKSNKNILKINKSCSSSLKLDKNNSIMNRSSFTNYMIINYNSQYKNYINEYENNDIHNLDSSFNKNYNNKFDIDYLSDLSYNDISVLDLKKNNINNILVVNNNSFSLLKSNVLKNNNNNNNNNSLYKILVIEDNKLLRNSIDKKVKKALSNLKIDCNVLSGEDGIDCLKHILDDQNEGNKIKLIISDENMEYMNGSEAVKIIKELVVKSKLKILPQFICITAFEDEATKDNLILNGFNKIIEKNTNVDVYENIIKDVFSTF